MLESLPPFLGTQRTEIPMKTIGNILWLLLAGLWLALGYAASGIVLCITIVGIPFGVQAFKLAAFALWPFGRSVVRDTDGGFVEIIANLIWLVLFGWGLFLAHLAAGVLLCLTVIGIPFGFQAFKMSVPALWPFGCSVIPSRMVDASATVAYSAPANPMTPEA